MVSSGSIATPRAPPGGRHHATGDLKWEAGRYDNGQVLVASDHLVVTTDAGQVVLDRNGAQMGRLNLARRHASADSAA